MQASLEGPEGISTIRSRLQRNVEGRRLRSAPFLLALRHQARWSAFPSHPRRSAGFGPEPEESYGLDRGFVLGGEYFRPYESEYFAR